MDAANDNTPPAIPYSPVATVGGWNIRVEPDRTTATFLLSRRRAIGLFSTAMGGTLVFFAFLIAAHVLPTNSRKLGMELLPLGAWVTGFIALAYIADGIQRLIVLSKSPSFEASMAGLRTRFQSLTQMDDSVIPRKLISLVVADRYNLQNKTVIRKMGVRLHLQGGSSHALWFGPPAESRALAAALNRAMGLELWEPAPLPRWSKVQFLAGSDGISMHLGARHFAVVALAFWVLSSLAIALLVTYAGGFSRRNADTYGPLTGFVVLGGLLGGVALSEQTKKYRRSINLVLNQHTLHIVEMGLRPGAQDVATGTILSFDVEPDGALVVATKDGQRHLIANGRPPRVIAWLQATLQTALGRAQACKTATDETTPG